MKTGQHQLCSGGSLLGQVLWPGTTLAIILVTVKGPSLSKIFMGLPLLQCITKKKVHRGAPALQKTDHKMPIFLLK